MKMKLELNQSNALRLLADAFTGRRTFVNELLQNARRAGASKIVVHSEKNLLRVFDDGCGVSDFQKLLTLCESGWSADVVEHDQPYGVGFLSAILASKSFVVVSGGKMLTANVDELLAGKPADIDTEFAPTLPDDMTTGVYLDMRDSIPYITDVLGPAVRGFPVPVELSTGLQYERPLAEDVGRYKLHLDGIGTLVWDGVADRSYIPDAQLFLQGLPIYLPKQQAGIRNKNDYYGSAHFGLHLDSKLFKGRMPDRDQLIGDDFSWIIKPVHDAIVQMWEQSLEDCKFEPSYDFYKQLTCEHGRHLIEKVQVIPAGVFSKIDSDLEHVLLRSDNYPYYRSNGAVVCKESDFRFTDSIDLEDGADVAMLRCLEQNDVLIANYGILPSWACEHRIEVEAVQAVPVVDGKDAELSSVRLDIRGGGYIYAVECDSVRIELLDRDDNVVLSCVEDDFCPTVDGELYLVDGTCSASPYFFKQDYDFATEDQYDWDEVKIDSLCDSFNVEWAMHKGAGFEVLLQKALQGIDPRRLAGKTFTVQFSNDSWPKIEVHAS
jgi:hypothetical protein